MKLLTVSSNAELQKALGAGGKKRLVLFYSAWCPFCTAFMPAFEKEAAADPSRFVAACTDDAGDLEDLFSIDVVPTVLCFDGAKPSARLDGRLGRGLSAAELSAFAAACLKEGE